VPKWVNVSLFGFWLLMLIAQIGGPVCAFVYLQLINNYYLSAFADPNFDPYTFDFDGAAVYE